MSNFKEKLQKKIENGFREQRIKTKKHNEFKSKINSQIEEENRNLTKKEKLNKILKVSLIVILYDLLRAYIRFKINKPYFEMTDIVFSILAIALYSYVLWNYSKFKDRISQKNK